MQQFFSSDTYNMNATTIMRILCSYNVSERHVDAASTGDTGTAVNAALCNENYMVST